MVRSIIRVLGDRARDVGVEGGRGGAVVVIQRFGGLPEVITDDVDGFQRDVDAIDGMATAAGALLTDRALHARIASAAVSSVRTRFCEEHVVPMYEQYYRAVLV